MFVLETVQHLKGHQEASRKRIRVLYNGVYVADSIATKLVWEHDFYPAIHIPSIDVQTSYIKDLSDDGATNTEKSKTVKLQVGKKYTDQVTWFLDGDLKDHIRFQFSEMDQWFEEDVPIYVHAKDPYKRIDVLPSKRRIVVKIGGVVVAETDSPVLLFETLLRTRYYLPKTSITKWENLIESKTTSMCPYKGTANYYSVKIGSKVYEDCIWWYRLPTQEAMAITGMVCFYTEKEGVEIWIDGVKEDT